MGILCLEKTQETPKHLISTYRAPKRHLNIKNFLTRKNIAELRNMINSTERSDILVFNCYLCHVSFLLTCYVCSTKIGEISDISKCFENFVSQALGVLTRIYAAELRL